MLDATSPPPFTVGLETLTALAGGAAAAAACVLAYCAWIGLRTWRDEALGRRKIDLARQALILFYRTPDEIAALRDPSSAPGDALRDGRDSSSGAGSRSRSRSRSAEERAFYEGYEPIRKRLSEQSELFAQMRLLQYEVKAEFGPQYSEPFDRFIEKIYRKLHISLHLSLQLGPKSTCEDRRKFDRILFDYGHSDDPMRQELDSLIERAEALFRPVLEKGR